MITTKKIFIIIGIFSFKNNLIGDIRGDWIPYFVNLGYEIEKYDSNNLSIGLLLPDDNFIGFLIGIGYLKRISEKNEMSTGFKLIKDVWDDLEETKKGDMVVVKKDNKQITASFEEVKNNIFYYKKVEDNSKTIEGVLKENPQNIQISLVNNKRFNPPKRNKFSAVSENNYIEANFGLDYSQLTSTGSNLLSFVGNLAKLDRQASEPFTMGEDKVKLSFNEVLFTKNSEISEFILTNFTSDFNSETVLNTDFSIFNTYKNLDYFLSMSIPKKVFLFSRSNRKVQSGIKMFDDMWSIRKDDLTQNFKELIKPRFNVEYCVFEMETYA